MLGLVGNLSEFFQEQFTEPAAWAEKLYLEEEKTIPALGNSFPGIMTIYDCPSSLISMA